MRSSIRSLLATSTLLSFWALPAAGDTPSRAAIAKAGKAATALVKSQQSPLSGQGGQGTAFCIHPSGLFITNEHVVGRQQNVSLVLDPGQNTVKTLPAKVLRIDKNLDLALLRLEGMKDLPTLGLGSDANLSETEEVLAIGFPFGQALAFNPADASDYPAPSINLGSITSLRNKNGSLDRIQVDITLNPGNSGGPVLDREGKVVGVVASGVVRGSPGSVGAATGVNFAIPVSHVRRFLARPEILFDAPMLKWSSLHDETEFQAKVLSFLPGAPPVRLELVLDLGRKNVRKFEMQERDGAYRLRAVPVPHPEASDALRLTATYPLGSISGQVNDQAFKVAGTALQLSSVRRVALSPGLDAVPVRFGSASVSLDLSKATEVRLAPLTDLQAMTSTVIAHSDGKEVGRVSRQLRVEGAAAGPDDVFLDIETAPLEKQIVEHRLAAHIRDLAAGGGGRFLVLHLPDRQELAIFDVNEAKVVKSLPVADGSVHLAAGLDKLVLALPSTRTLQRWNLKTFELELTTPYPAGTDIISLSMGAASRGPVVVYAKEGNDRGAAFNQTVFFLLDADKLERREIGWSRVGHHHPVSSEAVHLRTSLHGEATGVWCTMQSPSGVTWIRWENQVGASTYAHETRGHVVPAPGGKVLFTGVGVFTKIAMLGQDQSQTYPGTDPAGCYLPAYQSGYFLRLGTRGALPNNVVRPRLPGQTRSSDQSWSARGVAVYRFDVDTPVLTFPDIAVPDSSVGEYQAGDDFTLDKRFVFVPAGKLLVVVPPTNDRLVLYRADLEKASP
jgi:S1-C subfamily serine protease